MGPHFLDRLFAPRAIAVFGANERPEAVGGRVFENLCESGFAGGLYPINPKHKKVRGHTCHPDIASVGQPVDLAVIATPAATVPDILQACGEHGVRAAIVMSAGFGEGDGRGAALEKSIVDIARRHGIRLLGPNCLGLIRPSAHMNATFSKNTALPGNLALISQSGALCTAILDWATDLEIGFSAMVSLGSAADVGFGDILDFLAQDPETHSILLYVEGVRDARRFMSGLRIAARMKPVIVIKAGRHEAGSRAATTHSGAMIGADDVFDAALQRAGAIRVMTIEQLFAAANLLSTPHRVQGRRLAIITNGGGPAVMAVDRAIDLGLEPATLSRETIETLDKTLPAHWSHANPIDVLGDAGPLRYADAVLACRHDPNIDGILAILTPQAMTDATACAEAIVGAHDSDRKPLLACWMGAAQVDEANRVFLRHQIPAFDNPESAVEAFAYLASYYRSQQQLMQVPAPMARTSDANVEGARLIIEGVLAERRSILTTAESKALLRAFGIPMTQALEADSANAALVAASSVGFPVAIKINSPDITHKSDVNGVRLNVTHAQAVRNTFQELVKQARDKFPNANIKGVTVEPMHSPAHGRELLVGVVHDPVFGPAITFGAGGTQVEVLRDRAVALPPLNSFLAESMIGMTRYARALHAFRGMPAINMDALVQVLRRVSEMVCELPQIRSLDINPLIADEDGVMALDARVEVQHPPQSLDRYRHMAIHPYPTHLITQWQLADGTDVIIRPIRPEDAGIEQAFVHSLSPESKYFRFMQGLNELTQDMLIRFTQIDYHREMALVATLDDGPPETELGVARYMMNPDGRSCEFALVVADTWQRKGIGSRLMLSLMEAARERGFEVMSGEVLAYNTHMLELVRSLGFDLHTSHDDSSIKVATKAL